MTTEHPKSEGKSAGAARRVRSVIEPARLLEGAGLPVRRTFPTGKLDRIDPFLLLDHVGPVTWAPGEAVGVPDHPHRGFEAMTYVLDGALRYSDSRGDAGVLGPRDLQWLTTGGGLVHSEMPDTELRRTGGVLHYLQLWSNLPREERMVLPRYQLVRAGHVPTVSFDEDGSMVRILAGSALGRRSRLETGVDVTILHMRVAPGRTLELPLPFHFNALVYVMSGSGACGEESRRIDEGKAARFDSGGERAVVHCSPGGEALEAMLMAGRPLREPIARGGPFVMSTREEILQAFEDHRLGSLGRGRSG